MLLRPGAHVVSDKRKTSSAELAETHRDGKRVRDVSDLQEEEELGHSFHMFFEHPPESFPRSKHNTSPNSASPAAATVIYRRQDGTQKISECHFDAVFPDIISSQWQHLSQPY